MSVTGDKPLSESALVKGAAVSISTKEYCRLTIYVSTLSSASQEPLPHDANTVILISISLYSMN